VKYTTTGPTAPTTDGIDEAPTEESPLPAGAGDAEVDDNIDDENLDADHDDDVIIQVARVRAVMNTECDLRLHGRYDMGGNRPIYMMLPLGFENE
jgi:hypothetical protein